jgi:hypothetical protein
MSNIRYIKTNQRAELRFPDLTLHFNSVSEALDRWRMLAAEEKEHVVLGCEAGDVYQPPEIALLRTRAV